MTWTLRRDRRWQKLQAELSDAHARIAKLEQALERTQQKVTAGINERARLHQHLARLLS